MDGVAKRQVPVDGSFYLAAKIFLEHQLDNHYYQEHLAKGVRIRNSTTGLTTVELVSVYCRAVMARGTTTPLLVGDGVPDSLKDIELWVSRVSGVPVADIKPQYKLGGGTKRKASKEGEPSSKQKNDNKLLSFMSIVADMLHGGASGGASTSAATGAGEVPDVCE